MARPSSWLPLNSSLFVSLFLFMGLFGYEVHVFDIHEVIVPVLIAIGIIVVLFFTVQRSFNLDLLYQIAALFIILGLFLTPTGGAFFPLLHNVALSIAVICFYFLETLVLASLASRNQAGGLSFVALGNSVCLLGTICGSLFKHLDDALSALYPQSSLVLITLLVVGFVAYVIIGLKQFSFQNTLAQIDPSEKTSTLSQQDLMRACEKVSIRCRLTQRETEVLELLARGRNSIVIERELIISRNTIKTHVRHIYEKLGCHNQQELIDVIEEADQAR
jgi:DNA-binding CsgD family transcriptional regulator